MVKFKLLSSLLRCSGFVSFVASNFHCTEAEVALVFHAMLLTLSFSSLAYLFPFSVGLGWPGWHRVAHLGSQEEVQ